MLNRSIKQAPLIRQTSDEFPALPGERSASKAHMPASFVATKRVAPNTRNALKFDSEELYPKLPGSAASKVETDTLVTKVDSDQFEQGTKKKKNKKKKYLLVI